MTDVTCTGTVSLWSLGLDQHRPHSLHAPGRTYVESNCYADVLIELLHARGDEPLAMLGSIARTDWEGDQFTYAKPMGSDLERLYGIDIHEMLPYRTLPEHIEEQLGGGRTVLMEIDGFYLPDTAATSYRREHLKTTVAPEAIDRQGEWMRYFHNAGYYELSGEDYRGAFRMLDQFTEDVMDPFTERVTFDAGPSLTGAALRDEARALLIRHLARRPERNPFAAWAESLAADLPRLLEGTAQNYHEYAFVTARMVGSAFELFADHVQWVLEGESAAAPAAFRRVVDGSKTISFRLARRRPFDPDTALEAMITAWDEGMAALADALAP
jgi:hypothetical protein